MYIARTVRRLAVAAPVVLLALGATHGIALAHEDHEGGGGRPEPFPVTCEGVNYVITSGNGEWSAAVDRNSRTVFIPKSFSFTVTMNGEVVESETLHQGNGNAHKKQETITCVFGESFTDPETGDTFEFSGSATVVRRP